MSDSSSSPSPQPPVNSPTFGAAPTKKRSAVLPAIIAALGVLVIGGLLLAILKPWKSGQADLPLTESLNHDGFVAWNLPKIQDWQPRVIEQDGINHVVGPDGCSVITRQELISEDMRRDKDVDSTEFLGKNWMDQQEQSSALSNLEYSELGPVIINFQAEDLGTAEFSGGTANYRADNLNKEFKTSFAYRGFAQQNVFMWYAITCPADVSGTDKDKTQEIIDGLRIDLDGKPYTPSGE